MQGQDIARDKLPAPALFEEEMLLYARERLKNARTAFEGGDPFDAAVMHAAVRRMLKTIAEVGERNCAFVVEMAVKGFADAHATLADMINEHNERGAPLGSSLHFYNNVLSRKGPPEVHPPEGRPNANFLEDFVIVCLIIDLQRQFPGLRLRRNPASKRLSACAIVSKVLIDAGCNRGGEEAIRRIYERSGPPAIPRYREPPPPGVVRFTNGG